MRQLEEEVIPDIKKAVGSHGAQDILFNGGKSQSSAVRRETEQSRWKHAAQDKESLNVSLP